MTHKLLLYYDTTLIGDLNKYAKNRKLSESLKSESASASADTFSFTINWTLFRRFVQKKTLAQDPSELLRVGKTKIVFIENNFIRFAGYLASRPARSGVGSRQNLELSFYEHFARLAGDLVCSTSNMNDPAVRFQDRPAHLFVQDLINLFITHATAAGETLDWTFGRVDTLANKTKTYKDFQTIAKALCDAMDNVQGAGKFDVVTRVDPEDHNHVIIDILKPRGKRKEIIIRYPGDGVYRLWAKDFSVEETNDYASHILVAGNGQVGDVNEGEQTANIGTAESTEFVQNYFYYRQYLTRSDLESQSAVDQAAATELANRAFSRETPNLAFRGIPIEWGNADNDNNGLALGDIFYFSEETDDIGDNSGYYRIIAIEETWDDNGVANVTPTLLPASVGTP